MLVLVLAVYPASGSPVFVKDQVSLQYSQAGQQTYLAICGSDMSAASVDVPVAPFPCTKIERVAFDDPNILDYLKRYPHCNIWSELCFVRCCSTISAFLWI